MMITKFEAVCVILGVLISAISALVLGLRWIYRQGAASSKLVSAIEENTKATGKLSAAYDMFSAKTGDELLDHEKRITRVEDRLRAQDR